MAWVSRREGLGCDSKSSCSLFFAVFALPMILAWLLIWQGVVPILKERVDTKQAIIDQKESAIISLKEELNRIKESGKVYDPSYDVVTNRLHDANIRAETEKTRADAEHNRANGETKQAYQAQQNYENFRLDVIKANTQPISMSSSNYSLQAIQIVLRSFQDERAHLSVTNREAEMEARRMDRRIREANKAAEQAEQSATEAKNREEVRTRLQTVYPMWLAAFTEYKRKLNAYAEKNGGEAKHSETFPTFAELLDGSQRHLSITLGTNSSWECAARFTGVNGAIPVLELTCTGKKMKPVTMRLFYQGDQLYTDMILDGKSHFRNCSITSATNCVSIIDETLNWLTDEQEEEFGILAR